MDRTNGDVKEDEADATEGFGEETEEMEMDGCRMISLNLLSVSSESNWESLSVRIRQSDAEKREEEM